MRAGIDIGGTKIDAVAVDDHGRVLHRHRLPTGFGPSAVLENAVAAVAGLAGLAAIETDGFASVGVGVPGLVDSANGRVAHAVNLGLHGLDLAAELERRTGAPVRIENDVNAAALGAFQSLGGGIHSMAYLNVGTGLAAGIVLDGRLWSGARGTAGEIGHLPVDPHGPPCPCGQRGCLERFASGSAVAEQFPTDDPFPVRALFSAAESGDPLAVAVREEFVQGVASAIRMLVLSIDVELVVVGGGISSLGDRLGVPVRAVLDEWSSMSPLLASLGLPDRMRLLPDGSPVAALGAALVGAARPAASTGNPPALRGGSPLRGVS